MPRCNDCLDDVEYLPDDQYCEHCLEDIERLRIAAEKHNKEKNQ